MRKSNNQEGLEVDIGLQASEQNKLVKLELVTGFLDFWWTVNYTWLGASVNKQQH